MAGTFRGTSAIINAGNESQQYALVPTRVRIGLGASGRHIDSRSKRFAVIAAASTEATEKKLEQVQLGKSSLFVTPLGVGAWSWGDRSG
jgi:hypothetical protein